tara:strand:+ start:851 stop:3313 length:2463 start_codon:yes stop_codon:yes gene_type:complete
MAQSSAYYRIDNDVLIEFIYHDQSNPSAYQVEVDDNGSEVMFVNRIQADPTQKRHLISELGGNVVNFDVTSSAGYLAIENFAGRTLLLQNGKTYKFNLSGLSLAEQTSFEITGALGIYNYSSVTNIAVYTPTQNGQVEYKADGLIGGKITVASRANPLFANPDENVGNDINQVLGRFHAVQHLDESNKYALLGYDSTGAYDAYNYINNSLNWGGSNEADLLASQSNNTANINYIKYDTIRLHLRSGYNFAARNYEGFLFEVLVDRDSGIKNNLTQLVYLNSSNYELANPKPFILGETLFSKFIEVKVPTLINQNIEFNDLFYGDGSIGSSDLAVDSNYGISFKLISSLQSNGGFDYITTAEENKFTISREDEFQDFTVVVDDAADGDYFKIYGERDGSTAGFESFLLNKIQLSGDDIMVMFDVDVFEQIGVSFTKTFSTTYSQYEDFDTPIVFRPVIVNSNIAVNFSVDVTMRIWNQTDNTQIVKRASITVAQAAKYGKRLQKININGNNTLTEVYNILPNVSTNRKLTSLLSNMLPRSIKKVPAFIERYNIVVGTSGIFMNNNELEEVNSKPYVSSQNLIIEIPPFSTYLKFKIAKNMKGDLQNIELTNVDNVVLSFVDGSKKLKFNHIVDKSIDMGAGEVLFNISEANAVAIRGMNSRTFYISIDNGSDETMITSGKWAGNINNINNGNGIPPGDTTVLPDPDALDTSELEDTFNQEQSETGATNSTTGDSITAQSNTSNNQTQGGTTNTGSDFSNKPAKVSDKKFTPPSKLRYRADRSSYNNPRNTATGGGSGGSSSTTNNQGLFDSGSAKNTDNLL